MPIPLLLLFGFLRFRGVGMVDCPCFLFVNLFSFHFPTAYRTYSHKRHTPTRQYVRLLQRPKCDLGSIEMSRQDMMLGRPSGMRSQAPQAPKAAAARLDNTCRFRGAASCKRGLFSLVHSRGLLPFLLTNDAMLTAFSKKSVVYSMLPNL